MTFVINVPNAGQSPGLFPAQNNTNFSRLKAIQSGDHVFNDTAQPDDGVHKQSTMVARTDPSSLPAGTNGMNYVKTFGSTAMPFYYDGTSIYNIPPVRARITWNAAGTVQGTPFNATVSGAAGVYTITFTVALPSVIPQFSLYCIEPSSSIAVGKVLSFSTTTMVVRFMNQNNTTITNITQGNLIIVGG